MTSSAKRATDSRELRPPTRIWPVRWSGPRKIDGPRTKAPLRTSAHMVTSEIESARDAVRNAERAIMQAWGAYERASKALEQARVTIDLLDSVRGRLTQSRLRIENSGTHRTAPYSRSNQGEA